MKTLNFTFILFLFLALSCNKEVKPKVVTVESNFSNNNSSLDNRESEDISIAKFNVRGMSCKIGCARTIEKKLSKLEGAKSAKINFKEESGVIEFDRKKIDAKMIEKTIKSIGNKSTYRVENLEIL